MRPEDALAILHITPGQRRSISGQRVVRRQFRFILVDGLIQRGNTTRPRRFNHIDLQFGWHSVRTKIVDCTQQDAIRRSVLHGCQLTHRPLLLDDRSRILFPDRSQQLHSTLRIFRGDDLPSFRAQQRLRILQCSLQHLRQSRILPSRQEIERRDALRHIAIFLPDPGKELLIIDRNLQPRHQLNRSNLQRPAGLS